MANKTIHQLTQISALNDESEFAVWDESEGNTKKATLQQIQGDFAPVDEVTSGNMHSVTSNAVANHIINLSGSFNITLTPNGYANQSIGFSETLPNKNYVVAFEAESIGSILFTIMNKTTTGMSLNIRNLNDANLSITCNWSLLCKS